jgi:hypothetical protein
MKTRSILFVASFVIAASPGQAGEQAPAFAGWYDLIPPCQKRLYPQFDQPVIDKRKGRETCYAQTARFDAMTGLPRSFHVTVARNPDFKTQFAPDTLKKAPASILEIGKRKAWVWEDKKKVVIPLGDDKAVVLETDPASQAMPLVEYAKSLDYDRIEKALAKPPRKDFAVTLETFTVLKKGDSTQGLYAWAGHAKTTEPVGKKEDERFRWTYVLKDNSKIIVTTSDWKVERLVHETADGATVDLLK